MHFIRNTQKCLTRFFRQIGTQTPQIVVHSDVQHALRHDQPIVALESTIITHGMPHPENVETALLVEEQVRCNGAIPATIAIVDGCIKVGLTKEELFELAQKSQEHVIKCSRRDLPYVMAMNKSGGTTVAATMIIAHRVGLKIFATGGIGGVHRDGHLTMDISADLVELGRTPVAVVCSGVKSILDIPRTLEYLETQGVCVTTYDSPEGSFPDFYTRDSGCKVPYNLPTAESAAKLLDAWWQLKLKSGVLIGVPIPREFAADKESMAAAIKEASLQALQQGIIGKEVTPFMLSAIARITEGKSLQANIALIKNNASVAAKIAAALATHSMSKQSRSKTSKVQLKTPLVIGASILDLSFMVKRDQRDMQLDGATYISDTKQAAGGVGRNIAEGIFKLYGDVNFITAVGNDQIGQSLRQMTPAALQSNLIVDKTRSTSLCSIILDKYGDCKLILGNMDIHASITPDYLKAQTQMFRDAPLIIMDSNLTQESMTEILQQARKYRKPVFFEPTDMFIAGKPFQLPVELTQYIRFIKPNTHELKTIVETITGKQVDWKADNKIKNQLLQHTKSLIKQIEAQFSCIITTLGNHGILISFRPEAAQDARFLLEIPDNSKPVPHITRFYPAPIVSNIVNVSGAGDSFCAGFITAILRERTLDECIAAGFVAAERALQSDSAVPATYFVDTDAFECRYKQILTTLEQQSI